jgi:hypothetical protein
MHTRDEKRSCIPTNNDSYSATFKWYCYFCMLLPTWKRPEWIVQTIIGALCYALEEVNLAALAKHQNMLLVLINYKTRMSHVQRNCPSFLSPAWHPEEINFCSKVRKNHLSFDPRPIKKRALDDKAIEEFRCELLSLEERPAFLDSITVTQNVYQVMQLLVSKPQSLWKRSCLKHWFNPIHEPWHRTRVCIH